MFSTTVYGRKDEQKMSFTRVIKDRLKENVHDLLIVNVFNLTYQYQMTFSAAQQRLA